MGKQRGNLRWFTLRLGYSESQVLLRSLQTIQRNYTIPPGELDAETAAVWYSTKGCETAEMTDGETADWLRNLHRGKESNRELIGGWIRTLAGKKEGPRRLRIKWEDAAHFLTVLNDHRLLLAARNDIGQEEMDLQRVDRLGELESKQQTALLEMELMGLVMEEVLRLLDSPSPPG